MFVIAKCMNPEIHIPSFQCLIDFLNLRTIGSSTRESTRATRESTRATGHTARSTALGTSLSIQPNLKVHVTCQLVTLPKQAPIDHESRFGHETGDRQLTFA